MYFFGDIYVFMFQKKDCFIFLTPFDVFVLFLIASLFFKSTVAQSSIVESYSFVFIPPSPKKTADARSLNVHSAVYVLH